MEFSIFRLVSSILNAAFRPAAANADDTLTGSGLSGSDFDRTIDHNCVFVVAASLLLSHGSIRRLCVHVLRVRRNRERPRY